MANTNNSGGTEERDPGRMIRPDLTFIDMNLVKFTDQVEVWAWHGIDGALVVEVDTDPAKGRLRLIVNQEPIIKVDAEGGAL